MTESDWLKSTDPSRLLAFVGGQPGERRLRLFAAVCRLQQWPRFRDDVENQMTSALFDGGDGEFQVMSLDDTLLAANQASYQAIFGVPNTIAVAEVLALQAEHFRDIIGNPFRRIRFDPRWRTDDVIGLARGIELEQDFSRLPILADALMDAGCDDDDMLAHCHFAGPHVQGCWVVDLALGTEDWSKP